VCADTPLSERLDESDAAIVGRVVSERPGDVQGAAVRLLTVEVDQRVKGDVDRTLVVRSPSGTDCDVEVPMDKAIGLLLTKAPEGGEPRGGVIKVGIGIVILALVLGWALLRLRQGKRPNLPGAPQP